ncbi:MAG: hypothetical protein NVS9B4_25080 [Candidatus Acidiferrum sp.]
MSYVEKNLVPGEKLLYQTRHHWVVLIKPILVDLLLGLPGLWLLVEALRERRDGGRGVLANVPGGVQTAAIVGSILVVIGGIALTYGIIRRNATEMAVTDRRVLIKTGMGSRRTLDLVMTRVESIGVTESMWGRMLGYGDVVVHGTGGTPEPFLKIANPQEFRRQVQQQIGTRPA